MANEAPATTAAPAAAAAPPPAAVTATTTANTAEVKVTPPAGTAAPATTTAPAQAEPAKPAAPWMNAADPQKPKEEAKPVVDVKFELKAPDGTSMDAAALEGYVSFAKENGLTPAQAQKILDRDVASRKAADEALMAQVRQADQSNLKELQTRWGDKFGEYSEDTKRAFDYVDPDGSLRRDMERAGVGYYPPLVEAFKKFGGMLKNDSIRVPSIAGPNGKDNRSPQEQRTEYYRQKMEEQRKAAAARR